MLTETKAVVIWFLLSSGIVLG